MLRGTGKILRNILHIQSYGGEVFFWELYWTKKKLHNQTSYHLRQEY